MAPRKKKKRSRSSLAEVFFPRRPSPVIQRARAIERQRRGRSKPRGSARASNTAYVRWLEKESMLQTAGAQALQYSGKSRLWQNPFARPQPRRALDQADVWYTAYPISMITGERDSTLQALGDERLWDIFKQIGVRGLHTGPMKRAGGTRGWEFTPTVDGHFDRIGTSVDPVFGTEAQFRKLCETAAAHNAIIIDDIVPGHTGKGPDFRLAEFGFKDYPGIYHMVEIDRSDWSLLPDVPAGRDSVNINATTEGQLKRAGYIIGRLQRVIFAEPGVKETNWSATRAVAGVDGVERRWVYLHYFKEGQPSINWLDPSFAGMKLVVGDAVHSLTELGTSGLRLDANGFLGAEPSQGDEPAWSEGHPLSLTANQLVSGMVRKFGGFTFQELNLSMDDIKSMGATGADLSYDFVNRPAYHHALATGDTEFVRLTLRESLSLGIDPASLVHALQNHDELTYELVHFWTAHAHDEYQFRGESVTGMELMEIIRSELRAAVTGKNAPYNLLFTENGIACTTVSFIAAALGHKRTEGLSEKDIEDITRAHLLLAMFNAWQPGVLALSGWDLTGSLTLPRDDVAALISDGDTRWINRGAYDLLGHFPDSVAASSGMQRAECLYGPLPDQLSNPTSFASRLRSILEIRRRVKISHAHQVDIPDVSHKSLLAMIHELPGDDRAFQATVLNFSREETEGSVHSESLSAGSVVRHADARAAGDETTVDQLNNFPVALGPFEGQCLLVQSASDPPKP